MTRRVRFGEVGLPDGYLVYRLGYHGPTGTLLAHVGPPEPAPPHPRRRLFFRWAAARQYQPVGEWPDAATLGAFVLDPVRPFVYFTAVVYRQLDSGHWGGYGDGLYRFDLEAHHCDRLVQDGELRPPAGYARVMLLQVLSLGPDGRDLFCEVGLETLPLGDGSSHVDHWVMRLELATKELDPVTQMVAFWA